MNKPNKIMENCFCITILLEVACVIGIIIGIINYGNQFLETKIGIVLFILFIIFPLIMISIAGYVYIKKIKIGMSIITDSDDAVFGQIDIFCKGCEDDDSFYNKQIKVINYIYKKDGEVDKYLNNGNIRKLYKRLYQLNCRLDFDNNLYQAYSSIGFSLIASVIYAVLSKIHNDNNVIFIFIFLLSMLALFGFIFIKYSNKSSYNNEYEDQITEYEKKLLNNKIFQYEDEFKIDDNEYAILRTQQLSLNDSYSRKHKEKNKSRKQKNTNDINTIYQNNIKLNKDNEHKKEIKEEKWHLAMENNENLISQKSELSQFKNRIINNNFSKNDIKLLFKYRNLDYIKDRENAECDVDGLDRTLDIINNNCLYLSRYDKLNDAFEFCYYSPMVGVAGSSLYTTVGKIPPYVEDFYKNKRVLSLSTSGTISQMWGYYTNSFSGVCLVFDATQSLKDFQEVIYLKKEKSKSISANTIEMLQKLISKNAYIKCESWEYEQEVRILDESSRKYFKDEELKAVILGHNIKSYDKNLILEAIGKKSDIQVYQTYIDSINQNVRIIPIDCQIEMTGCELNSILKSYKGKYSLDLLKQIDSEFL